MESRSLGRLVDAAGNHLELVSGAPHDIDSGTSGGFFLPPYVTRLEHHDNQGRHSSTITSSFPFEIFSVIFKLQTKKNVLIKTEVSCLKFLE
jgi:hypothetical protein